MEIPIYHPVRKSHSLFADQYRIRNAFVVLVVVHVNIYCCKYVGKVDKNNYCSVASTQDSNFIRRDNMLHNTKRVTSDRVQQME